MPVMSDSELIKSIKKGDIKKAYFFWGKDTAAIENVTKKLTERLIAKQDRDMNYHFMNASDFSASELYDISQSMPFFADRIVTLINDLNAEGLRADELKLLFDAVSEADASTSTVIFYTTGVDLTGGKKSLSAKNKKLADHISKCGGIVTEFAYKKPNELVKHIQQRLGESGCFMSPKNAELLAEMLGCKLLDIDNECDKLSSYASSGEITEEMIELLASDQLETDAYKLSRAIIYGKRAEAFKILDKLYAHQAEPIPLLTVVSGSVMDLYRAKTALLSRRTESDVIEDFNYRGRDFAVKNAFRDCRSMSIEKLRYSISVLSDCDIDMKSKRTDPKVMLETAITKILTAK